MIDIENEIYTTIRNALKAIYPKSTISGNRFMAPTSFPAITIVEEDNRVYSRTIDSGECENHSSLVYDINVYSKSKTAKSECKSIIKSIDTILFRLGFERKSCNPAPHDNPSITRMTARYEAVVDKNKIIYRRT